MPVTGTATSLHLLWQLCNALGRAIWKPFRGPRQSPLDAWAAKTDRPLPDRERSRAAPCTCAICQTHFDSAKEHITVSSASRRSALSHGHRLPGRPTDVQKTNVPAGISRTWGSKMVACALAPTPLNGRVGEVSASRHRAMTLGTFSGLRGGDAAHRRLNTVGRSALQPALDWTAECPTSENGTAVNIEGMRKEFQPNTATSRRTTPQAGGSSPTIS